MYKLGSLVPRLLIFVAVWWICGKGNLGMRLYTDWAF